MTSGGSRSITIPIIYQIGPKLWICINNRQTHTQTHTHTTWKIYIQTSAFGASTRTRKARALRALALLVLIILERNVSRLLIYEHNIGLLYIVGKDFSFPVE